MRIWNSNRVLKRLWVIMYMPWLTQEIAKSFTLEKVKMIGFSNM